MTDNETTVLRLQANSIRIAARVHGPTEGEVVILLAGWPQTAHAWRHVQPLLAAAGFRAIAIDIPGVGASDMLPDGQGYDTGYVSDLLAAAVSAAGIDRFALVGHDVGSWVSYAWASRHPSMVAKLCLSEAAIPGITPDQAFGIVNAPRVFQFFFAAVPELPELLTSGRERDFFAWLFRNKSLVKNAITEKDIDAYTASYSRPGRMSAGFGYYRAVPKDIEQNRDAPPPPMPILAVGAEGSLGPALQNAIRSKRPDACGEVMIGVGHYILEEAPKDFVDLLLPFLRS